MGSGEVLGELESLVAEARVPGLAAVVMVGESVVWSGAVGWADLEARRPMTLDTVLNVGSVSKLITSTALMRLWEKGQLDLDADVSGYLPFLVRHPEHPGVPITPRQLLTHTGAVGDGKAYAASYACGDPAVGLPEWLSGYLTPGGRFWSRENFLRHPPGTRYAYSNVGYGLLGLIVQHVAGRDFSDFTREELFEPLGLKSTGWQLAEFDRDLLATPYWLAKPGEDPDAEEIGLLAGRVVEGELIPFCHYSFYNYPDGLLRTTARELARLTAAMLPSSGRRVLSAATRAEVFRDQLEDVPTPDGRLQGLGWRRTEPPSLAPSLGALWGHGGADPGIRAQVLHRRADGVTVVVITNRLIVGELLPILELLFREGADRAQATGPRHEDSPSPDQGTVVDQAEVSPDSKPSPKISSPAIRR